ncbi:MAG: hypothetical protein COB17_08475 [Sulfurimonas sp.]|nr:MAG: hypothetical protein COB17_08475 [Sulfurimonas sp.]
MRDAHRPTGGNIFCKKMFAGSQNSSMARYAFTLIEVMVSVMIISVVIATLLQMRGNSSHIFLSLDKKLKVNQLASFFISNENYGYENKNTSLDELISEFELEDDLRIKLKNTSVKIIYQEINTIDMSEFSSSKDNGNGSPNMIFELGRSILKTKDSSIALMRLKLQ